VKKDTVNVLFSLFIGIAIVTILAYLTGCAPKCKFAHKTEEQRKLDINEGFLRGLLTCSDGKDRYEWDLK